VPVDRRGEAVLPVADLDAGRLVAPFDLPIPLEVAFYLVYPEVRRTLPKLVAFRDWLLREAASQQQR